MNNLHQQWAVKILKEKDYQIHSSVPEVIQNTPWAEVCRFNTNKGFIYLKRAPPLLSIEANIIHLLYKEFQAKVPLLIAENATLHCFLMHDAGIQLHQYFKQNFNEAIFIQAMHDYSSLQMQASEKIALFLNKGVPDWRLDKLPMHYQDLIAQHKLLLEDGLTKEDLIALQQLSPKLSLLCQNLSQYKITETLSHCDFHDKNILIDIHTGQTTLIDLGEIAITHPFFSLHNCLYRTKENFSLSDIQYQRLVESCLKPWLQRESHHHLLEILSIIQQCWSIHSVLTEYRLMNSVDPKSFTELHRKGRLANNLKYWINQGREN